MALDLDPDRPSEVKKVDWGPPAQPVEAPIRREADLRQSQAQAQALVPGPARALEGPVHPTRRVEEPRQAPASEGQKELAPALEGRKEQTLASEVPLRRERQSRASVGRLVSAQVPAPE